MAGGEGRGETSGSKKERWERPGTSPRPLCLVSCGQHIGPTTHGCALGGKSCTEPIVLCCARPPPHLNPVCHLAPPSTLSPRAHARPHFAAGAAALAADGQVHHRRAEQGVLAGGIASGVRARVTPDRAWDGMREHTGWVGGWQTGATAARTGRQHKRRACVKWALRAGRAACTS